MFSVTMEYSGTRGERLTFFTCVLAQDAPALCCRLQTLLTVLPFMLRRVPVCVTDDLSHRIALAQAWAQVLAGNVPARR